MAPQQDGVKGRRWDYPTGLNLNYVPRSNKAIGFGELRALAQTCDLLRIVLESRKNQMAALDWVIRPREARPGSSASLWYKQGADAHPDISKDVKDRIKVITDFLQYPDRVNAWDQWLKSWMEEVYVIDAPAIWRRRNRDGTLYALEQIDGATIKPLIDASGRIPDPPSPAYQSVLHGVPAADYDRNELLYIPWNPRINDIYGLSKVEQILITVNTSIRRSLFQLNYYTEGSQPDAFMGLPKEWDLQQIKDFQDYMDSLLAGNLATRRKLRFVPSPFDYKETKSPPLKDTFDEYLARIICFTFEIAPDPFIEHVSRGAVEKSHTRALEVGLEPNQSYIKTVADRIIAEDFNSPDLEFKYIESREQDPKQQADIDNLYVRAGIYSIDEVRIARGKPPLGGPAGIPMLATAAGYVPLAAMTAPGIHSALAAAGGPAAQAIAHQRGEDTQGGRSNDGDSLDTEDEVGGGGQGGSGSEGSGGAVVDKYLQEYGDLFNKAFETYKAVNAQASQGGGSPWPIEVPDLNSPKYVAAEFSMSEPHSSDSTQAGIHPQSQSQPALNYYPQYQPSSNQRQRQRQRVRGRYRKNGVWEDIDPLAPVSNDNGDALTSLMNFRV